MESRLEALGEIHKILDGVEWSPDTLDQIAEVVTASGYTIHEPGYYEGSIQRFRLGATLYFDYEVQEGKVKCTRVAVVPYQEDPTFDYAFTKEGEDMEGSFPSITSDEALEALFEYFKTWTVGEDHKVLLEWEG